MKLTNVEFDKKVVQLIKDNYRPKVLYKYRVLLKEIKTCEDALAVDLLTNKYR